jgi:parallel beta-helix repeat protein
MFGTLRGWLRRSLQNGGMRPVRSHCRISRRVEELEYRELLTTFNVGFGDAYPTIGSVPWNDLTAGDTVLIHWRSAAQGGDYHEKINIAGQGTAAAPISVIGVPGPNGELPVINGANATTGYDDKTAYLGHQARGLITFTRSDANTQDFDFYKPLYITVDGLEVENANPNYTFTNSAGVVTQYSQNAAGIYIERGSNITIRNCNIHDSGNGFFAGSNDYAGNGGDGGMIRDVLFEYNYVHDNGTPNGYSEHNIYTEGVNFTFQYNHLGPLKATSGGANLKDRSAGTIIRYNDIEGGAHLLDLVHAQESASITTQLPSYRETYVYGNVLNDGANPTGSMVHYGGDDLGNQQDFRKGTLYFYNNTVIVQHNQFGPNGVYQTVVFQLATNDESADIRDNVFYDSAAPGAPAGTTPTLLAFAANGDNGGQYHMGVNWVSPGWVAWYNDQPTAGGSFTGTENFISNPANNPGFVNLQTYDLRLAPSSDLIDKAQPLAPAALVANPVTNQYVVHQKSAVRPVTGAAPDLGAFEADGVVTPIPGTLQFNSSSYSVNEAAGTATITVNRGNGSSGAVTVQFATIAGSAVAGSDYTAVTGTLSWADGDLSSKTIVVPILEDILVEGNETFSLTLSNATGGALLGTQATTTVTIVDNDAVQIPGSVQFNNSSYSVNEGAGTATITVNRVNGSDGPVTVQYATASGTATSGSDFTATTGTLTWAAGDASSKTIVVPIVDDSAVESSEAFSLTLSNPTGGAQLGTPATTTVTIADNDVALTRGKLQFDSSTYSVNEGAGTVTITVNRVGGSDGAVTVKYATAAGTAASGSDFTSKTGTLSWAAGDASSKTIVVPIVDDTLVEGNESFSLTLSNATGGATLGTPVTTSVTILDNDVALPKGQLQFAATNYSVSEGAGTVTITVTRTSGSAGAVTVQYRTYDMASDPNPAWGEGDYRTTSGKLTFAAGETSKTFSVKIIDDTQVESSEVFGVELLNPTGGATLGANSNAAVTILENDTGIEFSQPTFNVVEGTTFATISVTRSGNVNGISTVAYKTQEETAYAGQDFISTHGVLVFAAGETTKTFRIQIIDDSKAEGIEQLALSLTQPTGATLGGQVFARLFITDNDVVTTTAKKRR